MTDLALAHEILDTAALEAIVGQPKERTKNKVRPALDDLDRRWLAASSLCFIGTSDADGRCDVSPKGDPPGSLVKVIDDTTIAIPERPGNRRVDGYHNILANPYAGIVFIVPGRSDTLRVNGRAHLVTDAPWFDDLAVTGKRPILALVVDVEEVFGHCAKSLVRAKVWHPESWHPLDVSSVSATARAQRAEGTEDAQCRSIQDLEDSQVASYSEGLY